MKPIKLTISAFGPFKDQKTLDFNLLPSKGIFLISGETGSGKTTIFDAICYALYGEPSGGIRDQSMLRSKYADPSMPTFVELEFALRGKTYRIRRNPAYERKKERGTGTTTQNASAELYDENNKLLASKTNDVTNYIIDLFGLNKTQFTNIAMIAQNDFQKLLIANTDERSQILRKLFHTEAYKNFQDRIKADKSELDRLLDQHTLRLDHLVKSLVLSADYAQYDEIAMKQAQKPVDVDRIMVLLDQVLKVEGEELKERGTIANQINQTINALNAKIQLTKNQLDQQQKLTQKQAQLPLYTEAKTKAEAQLKTAQKAAEAIDGITTQLEQITQQLKLFEELRVISQAYQQNQTKIQSNDTLLKRQETQCAHLIQTNAQMNEQLNRYGNLDALLIQLNSEITQNKREMEELNQHLRDCKEYSSWNRTYQSLLTQYQNARTAYETKLKTYNLNEQRYHDEQAGYLAQTLKDNEPCPVCGSTHHPHIARISEGAPTKEALKQMKQQLETAQNTMSRCAQDCSAQKSKLEEKSAQLKRSHENIAYEDVTELAMLLNNQLTELQIKAQSLQNKAQELKEQISQKQKLELKLKQQEQTLLQLQNTQQTLAQEQAGLQARLQLQEKQLADFKTKLMYPSQNEAQLKHRTLTNQKAQLQSDLNQAQTAFQKHSQAYTQLTGEIASLQELLKDVKIENLESLQTQLREEEAKRDVLKNKEKAQFARIQNNQNALDQMRKLQDKYAKDLKRRTMIATLSDTINGNLTGKERIMLETYIQMTYFDRIIQRANARFMKMSSSHYELKRKDSKKSGMGKSGLELDIIDHYNGSERSVRSLSGGESFQAALSLALGLCDEIQANAGGISIEAMFIDEGFGSLDETSLNQALDTLYDLSQSNRLIGIISHVNELKQRIDHKIIVKKEPNGTSGFTIES